MGAANAKVTVCWKVEGMGKSVHTAVHYDTTSHPSSTNFADYKGGASYPNNGTAADPNGYMLPGAFCTGIPMPASGALYFRAHVIADTHKLSDEKTINVQ